MQDVLGHEVGFDVGVKSLQCFVINDRLVAVCEFSLIVAEHSREPVHVLQDVCEDLGGVSKRLTERLPDKLHRLVSKPLLLVFIVETTKDEGVKAHVSKESSVRVGVTKGVDVPADRRHVVKLTEEELVADHHIVDHIIVVWACLVVHGPTSINELKAVILHKLLDLSPF